VTTTVTSTIKESGGDYTTLTAWEAAKQANLVTADQIQIAELYAFTTYLNDSVTVSGWTMDATRYAEIRTATGQRGDGYSTGARIGYTASAVPVITLSVAGSRLTDIDMIGFSYTAQNNYGAKAYITSTSIKTLITGCRGFGFTRRVYDIDGFSGATIVANCFGECIATTGYSAFYFNRLYSGCAAYNNTAVQPSSTLWYGFEFAGDAAGRTWNIKNNLAVVSASGVGFKTISGGSGTYNFDYNASTDATASANGGTHNRDSQTFTFTDAANHDYTLTSGDAGAKDFGVDLSADSVYAFSVDWQGDTRSGSWDIGFDEYVAAGGGTTYPVSLTLGASAAFAASSIATLIRTISLAASAALSAQGAKIGTYPKSSTIAANAALDAVSVSTRPVSITLTASGGFSASGQVAKQAAAIFAASLGLTAAEVRTAIASVDLGIATIFSAGVNGTFNKSATFAASAALLATVPGVVSASLTLSITAGFDAAGGFNWFAVSPAAASWSGASDDSGNWTTATEGTDTWS